MILTIQIYLVNKREEQYISSYLKMKMKAIYTEEIWYLLADNCAQWSHRDKGKFSSKKNGKRKLEQIFVRFLKLPQLTKCCDFWAVQATNFTRPFMFFCSVEMSPESITPNWVLSPRPSRAQAAVARWPSDVSSVSPPLSPAPAPLRHVYSGAVCYHR